MTQTSNLLNTLKKCLRAKGLTYRHVAGVLKLSEASVKRLFAEESFSLQRLEAVCGLLDMSLGDLAKLADSGPQALAILSWEQETALAQNPELLTYFYLLLNGWTPAEIAHEYEVDGFQATRLLAALDRLKLIELYPRDKVRLLTARAIDWRKDGPVMRHYRDQAKTEFLHSDFRQRGELLTLATGQLSPASIALLERKLARLLKDFDELAEIDMNLSLEEKHSVGLLLAFRPWVFSMFAARKRKP